MWFVLFLVHLGNLCCVTGKTWSEGGCEGVQGEVFGSKERRIAGD